MRQTPGAQRTDVNIVGSSTFGRYPKISSEVTYNMYESDLWLISFAGYKRVLELLPRGGGRGLFHSIRGNCIIAVVNSSVYRINAGTNQDLATPIFIGNISTSSGEVYMDENLSNQICLVDGLNAYIYNHGGPAFLTVQDLTPGPIANPSYVTYINTYFLMGNANMQSSGSSFGIYQNKDADNIEYVLQQSIQTKPDYAIAMKRIPGQSSNVLVFGTAVCEIWTQVNQLDIFIRNQSVNVDYGCLSIPTIASCDQYIAWLGVNESNAPVIMVFSNQGAAQISTDGINHVLSELKFPQQSTGTFYRQDGHLFYQITFYNPNDNLTLVYDFETQKFFHLTDSNLNYHPAIDVIYFNQESYFLSLDNASLYKLSTNLTTFDENVTGADPSLIFEIPRIRVCKAIRHPDASQFRANGVYMMIEQGYDKDYIVLNQDSSTANYVPRVDLAISADSGITYSNYVSRDMQPEGYRQNIMTWEKLGAFNDLTLKFKFWGFSRFVVSNAFADIF